MFECKNVLAVAETVAMKETSGGINGFGKPILWANELHSFLGIEMDRGGKILSNYSKDIPPEVYRDISYLINESPLLGGRHHIYSNVFRIKRKETVLSDCIKIETEDYEELKETARCINDICTWLNFKYDELGEKNKKYNIIIHKIEFPFYE